MGKILPILMALIGVGAGIGAGIMLKPDHVEIAACAPEPAGDHAEPAPEVDEHGDAVVPEYVKMHNQFVIPVVKDGDMAALVVLSISIEVTPGGKEATFQREPNCGMRLIRCFLIMQMQAVLTGYSPAATI